MIDSCVAILPLWGQTVIDRFFETHFPNYLSAGNLDGSWFKQLDLLFVTTQDDIPLVWAHLEKASLPIPAHMHCHVSGVATSLKKGHPYQTLSTAFRHGIHKMSEVSPNFLFLNADCLFAQGSLKNASKYLNEGYQAVEAISPRVTGSTMLPALLPYRRADKTLVISSRDLAGLAQEHELERKSLHCWPGYLLFDPAPGLQVLHSFAHNGFFVHFADGPRDFEGPNDRDFVYDTVSDKHRIKKLLDSDEFFYVDFSELGSRELVSESEYLSPLAYRRWFNAGWPRAVHLENFQMPQVIKSKNFADEQIQEALKKVDGQIRPIIEELLSPTLRRRLMLDALYVREFMTKLGRRFNDLDRI